MKHFNFFKFIIVAAVAMVSSQVWGAETPVYTLTFTKLDNSNPYNSYATAHSYICENVSWSIVGNQSLNGNILRVGGKNTTATDRTSSSTAIVSSEAIGKVSINHSGVTNGKSSVITIDSIKVEGSTSWDFESSKTKIITTPSVNSAGTLDFILDEGNWDANSYFRITMNYKITGSNDCYLTINSIAFYEPAAPSTKKFYFKPQDGWTAADAKTNVWDATNDQWAGWMQQGTGDKAGYLVIDLPTTCNSIVLVRFAPAIENPSWETEESKPWNQSVDISLENTNLWKMTGWDGSDPKKAAGSTSNLYSIGEATYTNCSLTSGTWPTCSQESEAAFDLTITADVGYKLNNEVTASGCTAVWTPELEGDSTSGTLHVTITGDSASIAVGATSDKYTVTWMANGVEYGSKTDYSYNNALIMPATNPQPCDRNHFVGWTATQNYSDATAPSDLFTEAGDKVVTANVTYYAVYAKLSKNSEETFTSKLAYSGGTTTNMTGNNDAALLGLDEHRWSVIAEKGGATYYPGLNQSNYIALYYHAAGGNTITVTSLTGVTISNIKVYAKNSYKNFFVKVGENNVDAATDGSYPIDTTSFVIGNANSGNIQVQIDSIVIYNPPTYTSYSTACTVPTWTMSFVNQGHGAQVASQEVTHNTTTTAPTAPVATGWAFGGWYKEAACENAWDFTNDVVTRDITLYAKWTCGWKVAYNHGEAQDQTNNLAYNSETHEMTTTLHLDGNTTYYFHFTEGNWICGLHEYSAMTKDNNGPETKWNFQLSTEGYYSQNAGLITTATGDYTFHVVEDVHDTHLLLHAYVTYPASVAVTFNLNGHGADIIRYTTPGEALATLPADPTTTGFDFAGWYTDQACTTPWTSTEAISEDKTVYAKWTVARTTLYLNAGGSDLWDKDNPKFAVYYFNNTEDHGWSEFMTNYDGCDDIYRTTIPQGYDSIIYVRLRDTCTVPNWAGKFNQTNNLKLIESWNQCTITGWGNNGGNSTGSTSFYDPTVVVTLQYDGYTTDCDAQMSGPKCTTITLPAGKIVVGKTFAGWSYEKTTYSAGASYTMPANNVTLTATYTPWTITYNYNGTPTSPIEVPETGVVIPTEAQGDAVINNIFIGFTKTQNYSATDLPVDFIPAGSVYTPTADNETLYALYRQGDAQYQLIKDIKDLRLGAHVVLASLDEDYAMGNTFIEGQDTLPAIVVTKDGDAETITFGNEVQEWVLTTSSEAGRDATYQGTWVFNRSDNKKLASSNKVGKVTLGTNVTTGSSFRIAIDASGRATVQCAANYNISTLSMGDNGTFGCYNPNTIDAPDLAIYQHIGTKYVTTPTVVYRVKSVDMVNGRLDKNDYYAVNDSITLSGYANDGYSTANRYLVLGETSRDTISKTRGFRMPDYNVIDSLTNRAKQDTITFMVPECVASKPKDIKVDWNTVDYVLPDIANINSWNFIGWTKTAINDTSEVHSEIFTTYTIPHVDRDTFYAIYSYDGLPTTGFVLSTVNETTYYLGEYVSGSSNRYFRAVTDKSQALVLHNEDGKLYYHSADTLAYLQANAQGTSSVTYNLLTTNEAGATIWTITTENGVTSIKTNIGGSDRYLRYNTASSRYSIYTQYSDPVKEKAPSYTTNPVCNLYVHYFVTDDAEEPEYSYKLGDNRKAAQYYPNNDCPNKRFIGWSETKVSALQQEAPSMVNFENQTYDHTQNLYAVYAAPNGGKVNDYNPSTIELVSGMSYFKTAQDSGMSTLKTRYTFHNAKYHFNNPNHYIRLTKGNSADSSFVTTSLIRDLEKIQVVYNTSNTKPLVYISSDSSNWTKIALDLDGGNYYATPSTPGDYYVTLSVERSSNQSYSYSDISSLTFTLNKKYWYSDYSTNCNVAGAATITFTNGDESEAPESITVNQENIGQLITLPTPNPTGQHFDGWTIGDVQYNAGDKYKLSHDVTATASWSEAQLVCDVDTFYVSSAKGITNRSSMVAHISCPDITEGTLTIANDSNANGKLHAVITNAEADAQTGLNATVAIEFTPNAQNVNRNATMTATIGSLQKTFKVHGTSLPENFVIAHQGSDSKWYALPADITAYNTYKGYEVTINEGTATAPQNAVYHLGAGQDATSIRLMADTLALMTSATASAKTKIKVGNDTLNTLSYWKMVTDNNNTIAFVNTAANNSLKVNASNKFGMYVTGASNDSLLHIFKVTNTIATIPIETMNWTENSFSFIPSVDIPANNEFRLRVNDEDVETASCTDHNALYDVTSFTAFGAQKLVQLQWYNNSTLVATASAVTPLRLTSDATLAGIISCDTLDAKSLDIVVTSGTLTVNAKATIHNLDIYPGATVAITNDTLTATTLSFHGGLTSTESNYAYDVPRLYIQKESCTTAPGYLKKNARIYYYLNVNADNYYPFTVPFKTTGANIRYASRPNTEIQSIWGNAIVISQYNGEARGKGETTTTKYWEDLSYSTNLIPGVGYIITAKKLKGEPYAALRIMMMVSDIDATTDAVSVGAWGVDNDKIAWYNKGWNYIANPYTAMLNGNSDETYHAIQSGTDVRYATIPSPTVDGYDQVPIEEADLKPFYGFFIQAGATGNYNFAKNKLHSAPAYLLAEEKPEQRAYINLEGASLHDRFGLIVGPRHSDDYEFNADLSKELGTANDLRAWLMSGDMKMAYLAVDDETAATLIPLNLRTPAESDYTFSLRESSRVADLEGLFLTDYQEGTVTNLLYNNYTFSAPAGAVENRFALNAVRAAKAPTELGGEAERLKGRGDPPHKRLKDGHIYIIVNGAIYNAEGKEVRK